MSHAPLRLEDYFFTRLFFEANPGYSESGDNGSASMEVGINVELLKHESENNRFQLKLTLDASNTDESLLPYSFEIQVVGLFSVDPELKHENIPGLVKINGGSMLYSATREYLLIITGRGPWGSMKLPTVNFMGCGIGDKG